ncbi:MAG: metal ABC transporter substrate-binding protein [Nitrososphaerota archaeon]|jgi:zinc transport system substrate-binding protein|nr:metal ABC transporter substrate-binding protein [Nitrososphaerota archaeon]
MNQKQKLFLTTIIIITMTIAATITYVITSNSASNTSGKLQIVTTFYPLTFITQQIGGEHVEITQLIPSNTEVHNWEPSASHIKAAENADIIFYNGAGADHWMEDEILPALSNTKNRTIVETTDNLILIANQEHDDDHDEDDGHDDHDHGLYDPHTWISPYMAKQQAEIIYNTLITVDPQHENYYTQNWQSLKQQFEQLDTAYKNGLSNTSKNAIFVSHGAFGYLAERYGFIQYSVIGISADEQPSAQTIIKLIEEIKEHQIYILYVDPVYSNNYINTIQNEVQTQTGQTVEVLKLYLMLGPQDGLDYLEQMQTNLTNLQIGLLR